MNDIPLIITIDGPSASGKSTLSQKLSEHLEWNWVSTGAFYRSVGLLALRKEVRLDSEKEVLSALEFEDWSVCMSVHRTQVFIDGKDVSDQIYQEEVGSAASIISNHKNVRRAVLKAQRDCYELEKKGLVAEGRDCGSVIFPEAPLKVFLTADPEERALRRAQQEGLISSQAQEMQKIRDLRDYQRKFYPKIPSGAVRFDNSTQTLEESVKFLVDLAEKTFDILR